MADADTAWADPSSQGELKPYTPSWRDRLQGAIQDAMSGMGASRGYAQNFAEGAGNIASAVPVVGNVLSGNDAYRDYQGGNYLGALANAAMAVPLPGASVGEGVAREAEQAAEPVAKRIIAYHGSPHQFDQFDIGKIGIGEGAQAYGHGLYFAENEGVARSYRDALAKSDASRVKPDAQSEKDYGYAWDAIVKKIEDLQAKDKYNFKATEPLYGQLDNLHAQMVRETVERNPHLTKGSMYQVAINADPEHFLDWDKPLSQQGEKVRGAAKKLGIEGNAPEPYDGMKLNNGARLQVWDDPDFGRKYRMLMPNSGGAFNLTRTEVENLTGRIGEEYHGKGVVSKVSGEAGSDKGATETLRQAGIPGIKYLDAGSRASGDGSRNYVVFDPAIIEILKRYGLLGGMVGGAGMMAAQPGQDQAPDVAF